MTGTNLYLSEEQLAAIRAKVAPDWTPRPAITTKHILAVVEKQTRVSSRDMMGPWRFKHIVRARHILMFTLNHVAKKSLARIERACNRDHSTILHGIRKVGRNPDYFEPELSRVLATFDARRPS